MDFEQLHYFQTVVQYGNITRAAKELHLTQPALSKAISRMEHELGVKLFEREASKITLNESGKVFSRYVNSTLAGFQTCLNEIKSSKSLSLRIATVDDINLDMQLDTLQSHFVDLRIENRTLAPSELPPLLERGDVHVGFLALPKQFQQGWTPLRKQKWCIAAHIRHPVLSSGSPVTVQDLQDYPCNFCGSVETYEIILHAFSCRGLTPKLVHEPDSNKGMAFLTSNQGFTFVTYDIVYGWFHARPNLQVGVLDLDEPLLDRNVCIQQSEELPQGSSCRAACEFLCRSIQSEWTSIERFVQENIQQTCDTIHQVQVRE